MSKIVKHNGVAYFSGQVSEADTAAEQTREILAKVDALLAEAGSDKSQILSVTIYLKDMADYETFTHRFFFADKNVRKFRTSIVVSTEKATLDLPI